MQLASRWTGTTAHKNLIEAIVLVTGMLLQAYFSRFATAKGLFNIMMFIVLTALTVWPGAAYLGGRTLGWLRVGGRVPVSVWLKRQGTGTVSTPEKPISGCLILGLGNEVLLQETEFSSDCFLGGASNPTFVPASCAGEVSLVYSVTVIPQSEVVRMAPFEHKRPSNKVCSSVSH